jgi:carboxymethylenebutenolidase
MPRIHVLLAIVLTLSAPAAVQDITPPSAANAATRLAESPRHGEWVLVETTSGPVNSWVVYPERPENAPVIIVIHEIFGLTDWLRSVADGLAAEGFIAIAPDLLSGKGPDGGGTESIEQPRAAIRDLDPTEIRERLDALAAYGQALPASNGAVGVIGFCWGGSTTFRYATEQPATGAAVVFYGGSPDADALANLEVPVLGLYGGSDARVNATIAPAREVLDARGARYETEIYEGAGHGFLRAQNHEQLSAENTAAAGAAWTRMIGFLRELLES